MAAPETNGEDHIVEDFQRRQVELLQDDARCRALQLPEGILLRYTLVSSLYFYLRSGVRDGKIQTRVFATDSPYDREKTHIGEVTTAMFEAHADGKHIEKIQRLLNNWVEFVKPDVNQEQAFKSFTME